MKLLLQRVKQRLMDTSTEIGRLVGDHVAVTPGDDIFHGRWATPFLMVKDGEESHEPATNLQMAKSLPFTVYCYLVELSDIAAPSMGTGRDPGLFDLSELVYDALNDHRFDDAYEALFSTGFGAVEPIMAEDGQRILFRRAVRFVATLEDPTS